MNIEMALREMKDPGLERADPFEQPVVDGKVRYGITSFAVRLEDQDLLDALNQRLLAFRGHPRVPGDPGEARPHRGRAAARGHAHRQDLRRLRRPPPTAPCRYRAGTGPKAGGPHYLARLATERTVSVNTTAVGGSASLVSLEEAER